MWIYWPVETATRENVWVCWWKCVCIVALLTDLATFFDEFLYSFESLVYRFIHLKWPPIHMSMLESLNENRYWFNKIKFNGNDRLYLNFP